MTVAGPGRFLAVLLVLLIGLWPAPARADNWSIYIASWNVLNFGLRKAGLAPPVQDRTQLLDFYAGMISRYDIVFLQEVLDNGQSVTQAVANRPALVNYDCERVSAPSGRQGRQERYAICYYSRRGPGQGALTLNRVVDAMTTGLDYKAPDGTLQPAQQVWMRPPFQATFTYTPPPGDGAPYTFTVASSHTKPSYGAGARPAGTPASAPANRSVFNELQAIERNLAQQGGDWALMGDLNADCASYPVAYRGQNFPGPWTWYIGYGEKTNTAARSDCAYDRIIFSPGLNQEYQDHGIVTQGIAAPRLNGERVSDHHLVWVQIGRRRQKRPLLIASTAVPVSAAKRQRLIPPGSPVTINGTGVSLPTTATAPKLYVTAYNKAYYRTGHAPMPLTDVRGAPTPVTVNADGTLAADVVWSSPVAGNYSIVIDANGDQQFDRHAGDVANFDNQIDFIVESAPSHSRLTSKDDDGLSREVFNENRAINIYAAARGLTPGGAVRVYVTADQLLPESFTDWDTLKRKGTLDLGSVSVPINLTHGPIDEATLPSTARYTTETVGPTGALLTSGWPNPYRLFNMGIAQRSRPPPDYRPEYDSDDDDGEDPCATAWDSSDSNFQAVCNVVPQFADHYGTRFNFIVDANSNGILDAPDLVDVHEIGDMTTFFAGPPTRVLDASANGDPAVGEYKEYLSTKLSLHPPLSQDNVFGPDAAKASYTYACAAGLSKARFDSIVKPGAQNGFRVLDQDSYQRTMNAASGRYEFVDADIDTMTVPDDSSTCIVAEDLDLGTTTVGDRANLTLQTERLRLEGVATLEPKGQFCVLAAESVTIAGAAGYVALGDPEPITKTIFAIAFVGASILAAVESLGCAS